MMVLCPVEEGTHLWGLGSELRYFLDLGDNPRVLLLIGRSQEGSLSSVLFLLAFHPLYWEHRGRTAFLAGHSTSI